MSIDRTPRHLPALLCVITLSIVLMPGWLGAADLFQGAARLQATQEVQRLSAIQVTHQDALLALPGVHGVGIGATKTGELVFVVAVDPIGKAPELPLRIEGVDVVIDRSEPPALMHGGAGCIPCHSNQVALPVPMGNSTGNPFACFACTLGFKACKDGVIYYVTNAHCSQNAQGCEGKAPLGSNTLHRGRLDAPGCAVTTDIGDVSWSATPVCGQNNLVDGTRVISANNLTSWSIRDVGVPSTVSGTVLPGDTVQKSGRTTGYTTGTVNSVNYTTNVSPYCCGSAHFVDQIRINAITPPFLQGGDSGSAVLNMQNPPKIVGLLFAGAPNGSYGIANKIFWVLSRLSLSLDPNCQPPTCEDLCQQQLDFCEEEYCYWNYNQYMCQQGCDLQYQECVGSC